MECEVEAKLAGATRLYAEWRAGTLKAPIPAWPSDIPGRPSRPVLQSPKPCPCASSTAWKTMPH